MNTAQLWAMYFAGIMSIRMHPANDKAGYQPAFQAEWCASVADMMLKEHFKRWQPNGLRSTTWPG